MRAVFRFKQFEVDQSGCAMKINTDGVLLGAFVRAAHAETILDIGTGTGVIALMLAQIFNRAKIDAVETDPAAAETASRNFKNSPYHQRLKLYPLSFQEYFKAYGERKYDLIVTNPPFYIRSLEAPSRQRNLAKHADEVFFKELISGVSVHLTPAGHCWIILFIPTAQLVSGLISSVGLHIHKIITVSSFANVPAHREIIVFGKTQTSIAYESFIIYDEVKKYSAAYRDKLKDFFILF